MPKCTICGKRFDTLSSLREHHRAVHPNARFVAPKTKLTRNLLTLTISILIVVGGIVGYAIYVQSQQQTTTTVSSSLIDTPISSALYQNLSSVSTTTLSSIGSTQSGVTSPSPISDSALISNGKPEVLYIGDEWCPNCAAERWSLVVALSKFGSFTGLQYMASAADDGNIATITFSNASYTSQYISFVAVENQARNRTVIQNPTSTEQALWSKYSSTQSVPFIDFGGQYVLTGAQFSFTILSGDNWTEIGSQVNNPSSSIAKMIDGAANQIMGAICKMDSGQPSSICGQSFASVSFAPSSSRASNFQFFMLSSYEERHLEQYSSSFPL
jgi:hypothetical protein